MGGVYTNNTSDPGGQFMVCITLGRRSMKRLIVLILLSAFVAACGSSSSDTTESSTASVSRAMVTKKSALDTMADQVTTAHKQSVLTLFQGMFNAAPGADLCNLGASLLASGVTEMSEKMTIISADVALSEYGIKRIW